MLELTKIERIRTLNLKVDKLHGLNIKELKLTILKRIRGDKRKMLKSCSICGTIHEFNKTCRRSRKKKNTQANTFRKTNKWTEKSKCVRERDNYLCQICLLSKYNTNYKYTYEQLEVHHIVSIEEDYSKRLDSMNLITLCKYHHKMAEEGKISRGELLDIVASKY